MSKSPKNSSTDEGKLPDDTSDDAMRTQELSVGPKFRRAADVKTSFLKKNSKLTSGGTPSPTSGPRFTNKWKEVSNGFELVFAGDAEPECSLSITARGLMSNLKEYPSTYIAISGIPNFRPTDMPAIILPLMVENGIEITIGELERAFASGALFTMESSAVSTLFIEIPTIFHLSGQKVNVQMEDEECSEPFIFSLMVKFLLCYFGILTGLKRDIERCSYFTRDLCPKFNPTSASAELFLYFNRAFRPKLFYSNGSLHSTIPLLAGNGIDDLSDSLGPDWASSLLQDLNFLKEAIDTHSSLHQASKECSCHQACIACLMPDTVNMSLSTSNLRYLEIGLEDINFLKESHDPSSSWHSACLACFMRDAVNIMLLKICLRNFESQKKLLQIGPENLLIMNHHGTHY
jgi:hypothetical protein